MTPTDDKPFHARAVLTLVCALICSVVASVGRDALAHAQTVGKWHRHVVSITGSVSGNPFEAVVDGEFTHTSGTTIKLPGYYDGNQTWRFGFMPTKVGTWTWRTVSSQGSLDGETGSLEAVESGHPGLLKADPAHPRKWKYEDGPYVVPIGAFVNAMLDDASESQFTQMADFLRSNNFQLINFRISEHDRAFSNVSRREMHLDRWRRLERRMEILTARGLGAEIMLYTDDRGKPSFGPKSATEQLLIRYTVARLAGYPIVLFNSGIDIGEYRAGDWATWYGQQVRSQEPYGHPVSSRFKLASDWPRMNGETYTSDGGRNSRLSIMLDAHNRKNIPAMNTDNFSEELTNNSNAHTRDDIRRAAWKGVVVGGVGFHVRDKDIFCPSGITECDRYFRVTEVAQSLNAAPWIRLVNPFVQSRLGSTFGTMTYTASVVANGHALADPSRTKIMYLLMGRHDTWDPYRPKIDRLRALKDDDSSLTVTLGGLSGAYAATWFDPRTGQETSAGTFAAGQNHSMTPPSDPSNDWILLLEKRRVSGDMGSAADRPASMSWPILARHPRESLIPVSVHAPVASSRKVAPAPKSTTWPPRVMELWPEGVPGLLPDAPPERVEDRHVYNVSVATLTAFPAGPRHEPRAAVIVCPGGAYARLAVAKEGSEVTRFLNSLGVSVFVLKYRVEPYRYPAALLDVLRAVRFVRSNARQFGVDPARIGVFGSSAGGHLAASAGTLFDSPEGKTGAALDAVSARPDFVALLYPVITMTDPHAHDGSRDALLGPKPSKDVVQRTSLELHVRKDTPPTFLVHTAEDRSVPLEHSLMFYQSLRRAGVSTEMHVYEKGPHGFGLRADLGATSEWPLRFAEWLKAHAFLTKPSAVPKG